MKPIAVKHLRSWGLKFADDEKENPEEFLEQLQNCFESSDIPDYDITLALPCIFKGHDARWFLTVKREGPTFRDFERRVQVPKPVSRCLRWTCETI